MAKKGQMPMSGNMTSTKCMEDAMRRGMSGAMREMPQAPVKQPRKGKE